MAERRGEAEGVGSGGDVGRGGGAAAAGAEAEAEAEAEDEAAAAAAAAASPRCCAAKATKVGGAAHQPAEEDGGGGGGGCRGAAVVAVVVNVAGDVVVVVEAAPPAPISADGDAARTKGKRAPLCLRCGTAPAWRASEARLHGANDAAAATTTAVDELFDIEAALPDAARCLRPAAAAALLPIGGCESSADGGISEFQRRKTEEEEEYKRGLAREQFEIEVKQSKRSSRSFCFFFQQSIEPLSILLALSKLTILFPS